MAERGPARRRSTEPHRRDDPDRALRGLVGAGESKLPPAVAMRARDVARPTDDDVAAAEAELVLRYARPLAAEPAPLPTVLGRRPRRRPAPSAPNQTSAADHDKPDPEPNADPGGQ
nr:hypothetical protein [Micromonospora sp. DSM 115978]